MIGLAILQYNVNKNKDGVMTPLLADERVKMYDILAIQEPWTNPHMNSTFCPARSSFYAAYDEKKRRSCFLINKRLDIAGWEVEYPNPDICSLRLAIGEETIWIHNVYNPGLGSYSI